MRPTVVTRGSRAALPAEAAIGRSPGEPSAGVPAVGINDPGGPRAASISLHEW